MQVIWRVFLSRCRVHLWYPHEITILTVLEFSSIHRSESEQTKVIHDLLSEKNIYIYYECNNCMGKRKTKEHHKEGMRRKRCKIGTEVNGNTRKKLKYNENDQGAELIRKKGLYTNRNNEAWDTECRHEMEKGRKWKMYMECEMPSRTPDAFLTPLTNGDTTR